MKLTKIKLFKIEVSNGVTATSFLESAADFSHAAKVANEIISTQGYSNCKIKSISFFDESYIEIIK